jgi:hypothetical protein
MKVSERILINLTLDDAFIVQSMANLTPLEAFDSPSQCEHAIITLIPLLPKKVVLFVSTQKCIIWYYTLSHE